MCGRINISDHPGVQILMDYLDLPIFPDKFSPRYNIAPGAILYTALANNNTLESTFMRWGILPSWAQPGKFDRPLINARAESVWEKPSFRHLMKSQRVIIPVNGFYEWHREEKNKVPYYIHPATQKAMALAGLYQITKQGEMECCIVTTGSNKAMSPVHHRMPVILAPELMKDWLLSADRQYLDSLTQACAENFLQLDQVSEYVNNAANEGEKCVQKVEKMSRPSIHTQSSLDFK